MGAVFGVFQFLNRAAIYRPPDGRLLKKLSRRSWVEVKIFNGRSGHFWKKIGLPLFMLSAILAGAAWAATSIPTWVDDDIFGGNYATYSQRTADSVFGGLPSGPDVTVINETVNGFVGGGQSATADVFSNTVTIDGGTFVGVAVIGAATHSGAATNNKVYVKGAATEIGNAGGTLQPGQVYGGYVTNGEGDATRNAVTISGGTVNDAVVGGFIQGPIGHNWNPLWNSEGDGHALSNTVTVTGGTLKHLIFGGRANTGNANSNEVSISGAVTYEGTGIYGGLSEGGDASGNQVSINVALAGGADGVSVSGGHAAVSADNNIVEINGDFPSRYIVGGKAASASGNSVTISSTISPITTNQMEIFGGDATTTANNNSVILDGANITTPTNYNAHIYGGRAATVTGGTVNGNAVEIRDAKLTAPTSRNIYIIGGHGTAGSTEATDNTVRISGANTFTGNVNIIGGNDAADVVTGNTLEISPDDISTAINFASVSGFQTLHVRLPEDAVDGSTVLSVSGAVTLGRAASPAVSADVKIDGGKDIGKGDVVTLISAANLSAYGVGPADHLYPIGVDLDGRYTNWKVFTEGNNLKAELLGSVKITAPTFTPLTVGYAQPAAKSIGIALDAEDSIPADGVWLARGDNSDFTLSGSGESWAIQPKAGLKEGVHTDSIEVKTSDGIRGRAEITFTVTADGAAKPSVSISVAGDIKSVTVSGGEVVITYADGSVSKLSLSANQVNVTIPETMVASAPSFSGASVAATLSGNFIPAGTTLTIIATPIDADGKPTGSPVTITGTVTIVDGRTVISFPGAALDAGLYRLDYETAAGSNPHFAGVLSLRFAVTAADLNEGQNSENGNVGPNGADNGSDRLGGGCDAGAFSLAALALLASMKKPGKRR
jgi:hypothetical protein